MNRRVILIEDDSDTAEMMQMLLKSRDFATTHLHDRAHALDHIVCVRPAVVVLDVNTEGPPISVLVDSVRQRFPQIRLVLVSGTPNLTVVADALGVRFFLEKPFDPEKFLTLVEDAFKSGEHCSVTTQ
ncbi:MAG TPA: response regulator [Planctomycetota bacterium]|nr:response regulator [Planctomycetota bacterium]